MLNQFEVKSQMNQLVWSEKTRIQFVINNSLTQVNIFKIRITIKVEEIWWNCGLALLSHK